MRYLCAALLFLGCLRTEAKDRVADARTRKLPALKKMFADAGLSYPAGELYLRVFKKERVVEVWAGAAGSSLTRVAEYPVCAASGDLGPKREEGDSQVPEGFYEVKSFNPTSNFHLSLEVSYPNASDLILTTNKKRPGGLIYLHGNCVSIGCVAVTDGPAEEIYLMALDAKTRPIHLDIFPSRLDETALAGLKGSPHFAFWQGLAPGYQRFEKTHRPVPMRVEPKTGAYLLTQP